MTVTLAQVECAYKGKVRRCMCGCSGEYFDTTGDDADPARVQRILNKIQRGEAKREGNCVYIETPTMIYAVYLKPENQ